MLTHIKKLDDCFGDFLVRVTCKCGAVRELTGVARGRAAGAITCVTAQSTRPRADYGLPSGRICSLSLQLRLTRFKSLGAVRDANAR